jgi:hypothetical protein
LIRFCGPPANLVADVQLVRAGSVDAAIRLNKQVVPLRISGTAELITGLAFSLPNDTPPGETKGSVVLGDAQFDAVVDVQLRALIDVQPPSIRLEPSAGKTVTARLEVTNLGNGVLEYDADTAVTLRPAGTLARSVRVLKDGRRDFADRIVSLGEAIKSTQSHELAVTGRMAADPLQVGSHTTVTLELGMPEDLDTETTWKGSLALLGKRIRISVEALPSR